MTAEKMGEYEFNTIHTILLCVNQSNEEVLEITIVEIIFFYFIFSLSFVTNKEKF